MSAAAGNDFMSNLRQLFAECDLDGSGSLVESEFRELCGKIGITSEVAGATFSRLDSDQNGQITFEEFAAGFQQYKQTSTPSSSSQTTASASAAAGEQQLRRSPSQSPSSSFRSAGGGGGSGGSSQRLGPAPSPVSVRARSRASGGGGSSGNLTASGRSTSSSAAHFDLSASGSSYDFNSSCELPLQQSLSANDLLAPQPGQFQPIGPDENVVVYSSESMGIGGGGGGSGGSGGSGNNNNNNNNYNNNGSGYGAGLNSGQFGSLLSSSSHTSHSQLKTMQDLLECVQKLQNENQILTQIFFKDKREREDYISQLGEEFDHQLREVEERANKRAREELESEKKRLRDMMQTERETLQHHYQTLEKISKMVQSPQGGANGNSAGAHTDEGLFKVKSQLEDTFNENRQLKKSLLDTKTDVALIWKEMEKLKKQYEVKLSSAYEKQRETQYECDHIKKQLDLMQDSNRKLQDASDVITSYIADKVEPVIKVALDGEEHGAYSLNGLAGRAAGASSAANSRRGSILSEYLMNEAELAPPDAGSDRASSAGAGDLESMSSSLSGQQPARQRLQEARLAGSASSTKLSTKANGNPPPSEQFLDVPQTKQQQQADLKASKSATELTQAQSRLGSQELQETKQQAAELAKGESRALSDQKQAPPATSQQQQAAAGARSSLKDLGRHFMLAGRTLSDAKTVTSGGGGGRTEAAEVKAKAELKSVSADHAHEGPSVEPADGPSVATFNIILVGDSFVGKSSFAARFIEGNFVQGLISNCSIDFKTKSYKVEGVNYTVNLWDTAGQERFRSITASYFRKADGIILMYDVTDKRSYLNVRNWMSTISDTAAENVAVLLVGNKVDLRHSENKAKCVPTEEGFRLAKEYDIVFLETSVKTGSNLLPSMGKLIRMIAKNNMPEDEDTDRIRLSDKNRTFNCMPKNC